MSTLTFVNHPVILKTLEEKFKLTFALDCKINMRVQDLVCFKLKCYKITKENFLIT